MPGASPAQVLSTVFGFGEFRGVQEAATNAVVSGRDALVVMPTSGGKSLCFQVPGLCLPGLSVVVSPLLALMRDQCDQLRRKGVRASALASANAQDPEERRSVEAAIAERSLDFLYVSPERFTSRSFRQSLAGTPVSLVAIDEAHCVSEWGMDFRTEYLEVAGVLDSSFPHAVRVALTASAAPLAREDIVRRLLRRDPASFVSSFGRPNIALAVAATRDPLAGCVDNVPRDGTPAIVYCRTRRETEEVATRLREDGIDGARAYHAGLDDGERASIQDGFLTNAVSVIAATSAFGMGIDKPDVGAILHAGLPSSLEAYYQESGRAGRDGRHAKATLFWTAADVGRRTALASTLEPAQRGREIARLEQVMSYVETPGCRMDVLLRRFGESPTAPCGRCDACVSPPRVRDGRVEATAAVGLLRRMGDSGLTLACEILAGTSGDRVRTGGYSALPEFSVLRKLGASGSRRTYRQLAGLGLVEIDDATARARPTAHGLRVVDEDIQVLLPDDSAPPERGALLDGIPASRVDLWERLVTCRADYARASGVPPKSVASDADLAALVAGGDVGGLDQAFSEALRPLLEKRTPPAMPAAFEADFF